MTTITIRVIVLAHVAHVIGWVLIGSTPLLVEEFGLPVYLSGALAIPFFAIALWMYNAAAPRTDAGAVTGEPKGSLIDATKKQACSPGRGDARPRPGHAHDC